MSERKPKRIKITTQPIEIPGMAEHIKNIRERSEVRHVLAGHFRTTNLERIARLRRKHGM